MPQFEFEFESLKRQFDLLHGTIIAMSEELEYIKQLLATLVSEETEDLIVFPNIQ